MTLPVAASRGAAVGEHGGNDEDEIAHRHEGGDAGGNFLRNRSAVFLEAEEAFNDRCLHDV